MAWTAHGVGLVHRRSAPSDHARVGGEGGVGGGGAGSRRGEVLGRVVEALGVEVDAG
eukprot:CAMPEP_0197398904 /NCGR_PEP_ID=MMETSP1165-20131217/14227_1 /TAXON_ID=284809 /ORGANISM="Chrysocystis fragilis, Strain CCMP3189" /LENGTH=56 /DNA_ID=CAMNT_0042924877 /DNA_START=82 /DNA_END=248 /DNA_ORIENTATION=+